MTVFLVTAQTENQTPFPIGMYRSLNEAREFITKFFEGRSNEWALHLRVYETEYVDSQLVLTVSQYPHTKGEDNVHCGSSVQR